MGRLDLRFQCMSRESANPLAINTFLMVEELRRECDMRRASYPGRVSRGKMTQPDADRQIAIMEAIHADFAAELLFNQRAMAAYIERREAADRRLDGFKWADLLSCLRREIDLRRRYYPQMVAEQQMTQLSARHQLERIEAVHFRYWYMARRFWPEELDHKRYQSLALTEAERQIYRDAYAAHDARFLRIDEDPRGGYVPEGDNAGDVAHGEGWAA